MANKKERRKWGEGDSTISKIERVIRKIFLVLSVICLAESFMVPKPFLNGGIILLWIGLILMREKDVRMKWAYASFFKYLTILWGIAILWVVVFDYDIWKVFLLKSMISGGSPDPPIEAIMLFGNLDIPLFFFNLIMFLVLRKWRTKKSTEFAKEGYQKLKGEKPKEERPKREESEIEVIRIKEKKPSG